MKRWAVFISGRGSNLARLLQADRNEIDIRLVVTTDPMAYGVLRARRFGVPVCEIPRVSGAKKIAWPDVTQLLRARGVTHIALAGFMRIVPPEFLNEWRGRVVNLHPSLLPAYPGLESIERAHKDRAAMGLSVHDVSEEVDGGRLICQRQTLAAGENIDLSWAEFLVHVDEQRVFANVIEKMVSA